MRQFDITSAIEEFKRLSHLLAKEVANGKAHAIVLPSNDVFNAAESFLNANRDSIDFTMSTRDDNNTLPGYISFASPQLAQAFQKAMSASGYDTTLCEINTKGLPKSLRMIDRNGGRCTAHGLSL